MRRRDFIAISSGALLAPLTARAQQPESVRRVATLMPFSASDQESALEVAGFIEQLQSLGWKKGGNLLIDSRWAEGDMQRMQALADELVATKPDAILVRSTPVAAALLKRTRSIPVVFFVVSDPVGEGFVASLARPGGNATGFTNAEDSLTGKWLDLLKQISPSMTRLAFIFDPQVAPGRGRYYTRLIETAAPSFSLTTRAMPVHTATDVASGLAEFAQTPDGGLLVLPDAGTNFLRETIIKLASQYQLPAIYAFRNLVEEGGLMSYGVDVIELARRAANYVDRILRGARPADLPVQLPEKFELVINLKAANELKLPIPSRVLAIADRVVE